MELARIFADLMACLGGLVFEGGGLLPSNAESRRQGLWKPLCEAHPFCLRPCTALGMRSRRD
jgi:hypothetical protein